MQTNKRSIIDNILTNTKLRLKPSRVCDGVGLFTILPIAKGESILQDVTPDTTYISFRELEGLNASVRDYLVSICNSDESGIYLSRTPNNINLAYYVNHSMDPNVYHDLESDTFIAIKDIQVDQEIVCTYTPDEMW